MAVPIWHTSQIDELFMPGTFRDSILQYENGMMETDEGVYHLGGLAFISRSRNLRNKNTWNFPNLCKFEARKRLEQCTSHETRRDGRYIKVHDPKYCYCIVSPADPVLVTSTPTDMTGLPQGAPSAGQIFKSLYYERSDGRLVNALGQAIVDDRTGACKKVKRSGVSKLKSLVAEADKLKLYGAGLLKPYLQSGRLLESMCLPSDEVDEMMEWHAEFM